MAEDQPITQYERDMVANERCPRCRGELDTGWECQVCLYDAKWIVEGSRRIGKRLTPR